MAAEFGRWIADELAAFAKLPPNVPRIQGVEQTAARIVARTDRHATRAPHS
jgi:hypothetical protein